MQLFEWWEFSELAFLSLRSKSLFLLPQKNIQAKDLEVFLNGGSSRTRICDPLRVIQEMLANIQ